MVVVGGGQLRDEIVTKTSQILPLSLDECTCYHPHMASSLRRFAAMFIFLRIGNKEGWWRDFEGAMGHACGFHRSSLPTINILGQKLH